MKHHHVLGLALAFATLVTAAPERAHALDFTCKVKSVTMTWAEQTYLLCTSDTSDKSFTFKVPASVTNPAERLAALDRFMSVALAAQLSGRSLLLTGNEACVGTSCYINAARLLNE